MDRDVLDQVERRLRAVLDVLEGSLDANRLEMMRELVDAGEPGVALENLATELVERDVMISAETLGEMARLRDLMDMVITPWPRAEIRIDPIAREIAAPRPRVDRDFDVDLRFAADCSVRLVTETSGLEDGDPRLFPPQRGQDGVTIDVQAGELRWRGRFAFGTLSPRAPSCVIALPDGKRICVVAAGAGYVVAAADPDQWAEVPILPVMDVRVLASGVVVMADHTEMIAYDANGLRWRTRRISWDSLAIVSVDERLVRGEYWDPQTEQMASFTVDVGTGAVDGAAEIPG